MSRRVFGRSALAAAAAIGGATLGVGAAASAAPTRGSGKIKLVMEVSWQGGVDYAGTVQQLTDAFLHRHWTSKQRGVELITLAGPASNGNSESGAATIAGILAGQGADIVTACCSDIPSYLGTDILLPLDAWLRRDNVDMSVFPNSIMDEMTTPQGVLGLPDYAGHGPLYFNQSMLDDLGLRYPSPNWDYLEATKVWRAVSGERKGQRVYGMNFHHWGSGAQWVVRGWGGAPYDPTHTKCLLDSKESLDAYNWYAGIQVQKIATNGLDIVNCIGQGQAAFSFACCGSLQSAVLSLGNKIKWDLIPEPTYPKGRATYSGTGLIGINNQTKNPPELVWELFKFVTLDPRWQRYFNAQLSFQPPNNSNQQEWADWADTVRTVAPVMRNKNLEAFAQTWPGSWARAYYRYEPLGADSIWVKYEQQMESGTISVAGALQQISRQINAMEVAGGMVAANETHVLAEVKSELAKASGGARVAFTAPPKTGEGAPYKAAGALVAARGGTFTLTGGGSMAGGASDDGTFACSAVRSSVGTFTCRLASIAALDGKTLQGGAKIGLMARGDLSNGAPVVFLDLDGPNGVHVDERPMPGITQDHQHSGSGGLLSASGLVSSSSSSVANWLLKPLWLRWVRSGAVWTAYTSLDGAHWQQAGTPVSGVQMAGCWVGLFACSNNDPHMVRVVFDHVSGFTPNTFVVLGG